MRRKWDLCGPVREEIIPFFGDSEGLISRPEVWTQISTLSMYDFLEYSSSFHDASMPHGLRTISRLTIDVRFQFSNVLDFSIYS